MTCLSEQNGYINVHDISLVNGKNNDVVNAVVRDETGFLWLATDNGAKRYDGYTLKHFKHHPENPKSIGTHALSSLVLTRDNALWLAGRNLNHYNPETETFDSYEVSAGKNIWTLIEGDNDTLWLGGDGFGLVGFDVKTQKIIGEYLKGENAVGEGQGGDYVIDIARDVNTPNKIWVASSAGLLLFDTIKKTFKRYKTPIDSDSAMDSIVSVLVAKNGLIWIGSNDGVVVFNPNNEYMHQYKHDPDDMNSISSNNVWRIMQDSNDDIWIGSDKKGVNKYRPNSDDFLRIGSSASDTMRFPLSSITSISEDQRGSLWFSTGRFGVRRITENLERFEVYKHHSNIDDSLAHDNILGLLEDQNGYIWIATDGAGLDRFDPKTRLFQHYKHDAYDLTSISSNSVISLAEDKEGYIWVGTWAGGLNRLNPKTGEFTHIRHDVNKPDGQSLGNDNIFRLIFDEEGWLWISLWHKGVQRYNPATGEFRSYFASANKKHITNNSINDFHFSTDNNGSPVIWIAGHAALERFNIEDETSTEFTLSDIESIYDIYIEEKDELWLATSDGLMKFNPQTKEKKLYTDVEGLADSLVVSIEKDPMGYLWLGTRLGLSRFNPRNETFETFDELDGIAGSQLNRYSHLSSRSGMMYFGGAKGLTVFDPSKLPINDHKPNVVITDFEIFQKSIIPGKETFLPLHINFTKKIELTYEKRDIAFTFSALDFISPGKNKYRYRLDGLEKNWNEVDSTGRRVRYTNLEPGSYVFEVKGSNNDGGWNDKGAVVNVVILAPWWMTWWARIILFLMISCVIYIVVYWRIRYSDERKKELEALVNKKTKQIEAGNRSIRLLNADLERRVEKRTEELSLEVEERRLVEAKLFHMAFHDGLTGLPNRTWLIQQLELIIDGIENRKVVDFGLMFLDGDSFKKVNDTHGHMLGDKLLVAVARRLEELMPKDHHVIRLGGDEFTILIVEGTDEEHLIKIAESICAAFDHPFVIENNKLIFRVSIGMVLGGLSYDTPAQVLRDADISMYRAKANGKGTYQLFDKHIREQAVNLISLENDLQWALEREEFELVYQPIVSLECGELKGFEALLRWNNPDKGYIPPSIFIPVAEESGLILPIGLWVLREACLQLGCWLNECHLENPPTISVNISAIQLSQPDLIERIDRILFDSKIDSRLLKLEITESALMENTESMNKILDALRFRGIELAIDDFGTGYSSLSYLDKLPVQVLKIDRSFVDAMLKEGESGGASEIVRATISLAHNLKLKVVAEGIETQDQYNMLQSYGCDFGQGYLMSKPLSKNNATAYVLGTTIDVDADKEISTSVNQNYQIPW